MPFISVILSLSLSLSLSLFLSVSSSLVYTLEFKRARILQYRGLARTIMSSSRSKASRSFGVLAFPFLVLVFVLGREDDV